MTPMGTPSRSLKRRDGLLGARHHRLLPGDGADLVDRGVDDLRITDRGAEAHVDGDLLQTRDLHRGSCRRTASSSAAESLLVIELALARGLDGVVEVDLGRVAFSFFLPSSLVFLAITAPPGSQRRSWRCASSFRFRRLLTFTRVALPVLGSIRHHAAGEDAAPRSRRCRPAGCGRSASVWRLTEVDPLDDDLVVVEEDRFTRPCLPLYLPLMTTTVSPR